jgi:hypothetical protein
MSTSDFQTLKNIQRVLYACLVLLILAAAFALLGNVLHYFFAVVVAIILFMFHWFTRNNPKTAKWRKVFSMVVPVLTVLAPLLYLVKILFFSGSVAKWLVFINFTSVVLPMLLLMYAIYRLQKMIEQL